jgi:hypothetical protein
MYAHPPSDPVFAQEATALLNFPRVSLRVFPLPIKARYRYSSGDVFVRNKKITVIKHGSVANIQIKYLPGALPVYWCQTSLVIFSSNYKKL